MPDWAKLSYPRMHGHPFWEAVHACIPNPYHATHRENFLESCQFKPKSDCIYHFPIELDLNGRPFGSKMENTTLFRF